MMLSVFITSLFLLSQGSKQVFAPTLDFASIRVPPFVISAKEISVTFTIDIGEAAKRYGTGDKKEIYCFHPVPYSDECHLYWDAKCTLGGKPLDVMADVRGRNKFFFALANPQSGWASMTWKGILFQRIIRPQDKLATPIQLPPDELATYAHGRDYDLIRETDTKFNERMRAEGLARRDFETPYDFMRRVAAYIKAHFAPGPVEPGIDSRNDQLFNAKHMDCNPTAFFLAKVGMANGIPVRTMPGTTVDTFGVQRDIYTTGMAIHNRMEFFDSERGWVTVDGGNAEKDGEFAVGMDAPNWNFAPIQNGKIELGVMKPDGHWDATVHSENMACWVITQAVSRGGTGHIILGLPPEYGRSSFTCKQVPLDRFAGIRH